MSLPTPSSSAALVRCDLCCQLLPSTVALAAHAVSCFEQLSQAFNSGLPTAKGDWTAHTQAVLAASKLTASADELAAPSPPPLPPSSLTRKDDPVQERKLLAGHAYVLLKLLEANDGSASSKAVSSDALTSQLVQLESAHTKALSEFSQQLLSQLPGGAADGTDDAATKVLLSAGVRLCSFVLNEIAFARGQPSRLLLHPPSLAALSVEEFAQRFIDAWIRHGQESLYMNAGYPNGLCSPVHRPRGRFALRTPSLASLTGVVLFLMLLLLLLM
jgi:hypothetical protein